MNDEAIELDKVIELGKVSEETKGATGIMEKPNDFLQGPHG